MTHRCEGYLPFDSHGGALDWCAEIDQRPGELWAGNGEYASQVNYCPYCGHKADVQLTPATHHQHGRDVTLWRPPT